MLEQLKADVLAANLALPAHHRNARVNSWQNTPQKRTSVGVVWVIAHVGLKRKL
ncbi:hypothetical protein FJD25_003107 [Escherichia coli]|nr:hypothetical protein [Escherichia coli]